MTGADRFKSTRAVIREEGDGLRRRTSEEVGLSDRPCLSMSRFMVTKKGKYNVNDTQINSLFTSSSFNSGLLLLQNFMRHVK